MRAAMKFCSLKTGLVFLLGAALCSPWLAPGTARAAEAPPNLHRGAPIIPWAKEAGENRFRSPRSYDETLTYYTKVLHGSWNVSFEKIINVSGTRGKFIRNKNKGERWEGLNVYEHKGATFVFVVFSDAELARIAKEKDAAARKRTGGDAGAKDPPKPTGAPAGTRRRRPAQDCWRIV
ncbi:MAG TPA: hypothetical protein PK668_07525 [Myxococcota bacterium]|nr:hypothetical protein [Myxococcota bacterium]HRY92305.1 hypothetical protein [Myxococcota bacterium]HSA23742.1 hypothetical protein [Myxococcota bacterium]